jgi:hypothetical protein
MAQLPPDTRRRNALILALKGAMEASLDGSDWKELGYATDTADWITSHPRLLRSLQWGTQTMEVTFLMRSNIC